MQKSERNKSNLIQKYDIFVSMPSLSNKVSKIWEPDQHFGGLCPLAHLRMVLVSPADVAVSARKADIMRSMCWG